MEGQAALDAKDYKKAEELFRRAEALFNAPTLLLGLARASAGEGKFVEAWEAYNRIILDGLTTTPAFADALENAKKEIGSVEGRRSRVILNVTGPATPHATLDESPVQSDALGVPIFLDPGVHAVKVTADGFDPIAQKFEVAEGKTANVSLAMVNNPSAVGSPSSSSSPAPGPAPAWSTQKTLALVAGGVGVVGLGVGIAFGVVATSEASTTKNECQPATCTPQGHASALDDHNSAATAGDVSTATFIVGGVGLVAAAVLWFTAPKGEKSPAPATALAIGGLRFDPVVSAHGTSMMVSGSFQ